MVVDATPRDLKLVWGAGGLEIDLLPLQGLWTEQQYLKLSGATNHLIEFTDGVIEILPMPTERHQAIVEFLHSMLRSWALRNGGKARFSPLRVRIGEGKFREPDVLFLRDANDPRRQDRFWLGADLVVEVVSPHDSERDTLVKRGDYAAAGIAEYWIVNPEDETVTVLALAGPEYLEHGVFRRGETAGSLLLHGFAVAVNDVFDAS